MGGSSTKVVERVVVENQVQVPVFQIENQLETIRNEVTQQQPLITKNVKYELGTKQDTMVLRYSELQNKREISEHIQKMFKNEPQAVQFLTDAAEKMVAVFQGSSELKELSRWNQVTQIVNCENKAIGMELHYKVMIVEEKKGRVMSSTDTIVVLGYKFIKHALDVDPSSLPDDQKVRMLRF